MSNNSRSFLEYVGLAIWGAVAAYVIFYFLPLIPVIGPIASSSTFVQGIGYLNALGGFGCGIVALVKGMIALTTANNKSRSKSKSEDTPRSKSKSEEVTPEMTPEMTPDLNQDPNQAQTSQRVTDNKEAQKKAARDKATAELRETVKPRSKSKSKHMQRIYTAQKTDEERAQKTDEERAKEIAEERAELKESLKKFQTKINKQQQGDQFHIEKRG
jgi:hypothetical protein